MQSGTYVIVEVIFQVMIDLRIILSLMRTMEILVTIIVAVVAVAVVRQSTIDGVIEMVANGHPVCCIGKPCGDTCIDANEECHVGSGGATCSSNSDCACNQCDPDNSNECD